MTVLLVLALIVWAVSSVGLIVFVLLHSGKGTGLSEMLGGAMSTSATGTSLIEKNLDRITIGFAVAFGVSLLDAHGRSIRRASRAASRRVSRPVTSFAFPCSPVRDAVDWIRVQHAVRRRVRLGSLYTVDTSVRARAYAEGLSSDSLGARLGLFGAPIHPGWCARSRMEGPQRARDRPRAAAVPLGFALWRRAGRRQGRAGKLP